MKIGFIGLGHMGNPMARNLLKHGYALRIYDVVPDLVRASGAAIELSYPTVRKRDGYADPVLRAIENG